MVSTIENIFPCFFTVWECLSWSYICAAWNNSNTQSWCSKGHY